MATNEEIDAAWRDYLVAYDRGDVPRREHYATLKFGFLAGRKLPEVTAEELQEGRWYVAVVSGKPRIVVSIGDEWVIDCRSGYRHLSAEFAKFLGPLPLEDWGA